MDKYPSTEWERASRPEDIGWSSRGLGEARAYSSTIDTANVLVIDSGTVVDEWGDTSQPHWSGSIRKAIASALFGIHVAKGNIDLESTLADLGIDDNEPSLTDTEKSATIRHLMMSRSGVYHLPLAEAPEDASTRPERGSHEPGTFFWYNSWGFNALGTIFQHQVGSSVFKEFQDRLAGPLGMQDFKSLSQYPEGHTSAKPGLESIHLPYFFIVSARDLARFGLLYMRQGCWGGSQIVPRDWVELTTRAHSDFGQGRGGYGYMWQAPIGEGPYEVTLPDGSFFSTGFGGQHLIMIPAWDVVIVHQVDVLTDRDAAHRVGMQEFRPLLKQILLARQT